MTSLRSDESSNSDVLSPFLVYLGKKGYTKINVGWAEFTIFAVEDLKEGGHSCWGITDFDKLSISFNSNLPDGIAQETVIHEITHIICESVGFGDCNEAEVEDVGKVIRTGNEHLVTQLARGMLMVERLNPGIWETIYDWTPGTEEKSPITKSSPRKA